MEDYDFRASIYGYRRESKEHRLEQKAQRLLQNEGATPISRYKILLDGKDLRFHLREGLDRSLEEQVNSLRS